MKTLFHTFLLIILCSIISFGQREYLVKITTLDNHVKRGLLFHVEENGVFILRNNGHGFSKEKEYYVDKTVFIDFRMIKSIAIRRKGSIEKGMVIGLMVGALISVPIIKSSKSNNPIDGFAKGIGTLILGSSGGFLIGAGFGSINPHQFEVKKDTFALHKLKVQLKEYEWYHADKDTLINKKLK